MLSRGGKMDKELYLTLRRIEAAQEVAFESGFPKVFDNLVVAYDIVLEALDGLLVDQDDLEEADVRDFSEREFIQEVCIDYAEFVRGNSVHYQTREDFVARIRGLVEEYRWYWNATPIEMTDDELFSFAEETAKERMSDEAYRRRINQAVEKAFENLEKRRLEEELKRREHEKRDGALSHSA
jgi:hypothetical protein